MRGWALVAGVLIRNEEGVGKEEEAVLCLILGMASEEG